MARGRAGPLGGASGFHSRRAFLVGIAAAAVGVGVSRLIDLGQASHRIEPSHGRRLWIAADGSDAGGDGSRARPLASLQTAIDWAEPGTVIMVGGGTYKPARLIDVYKGDLTIRAVPGARPIFDAIGYATPGDYNDRVIRLRNVSNVTVVGLSFTHGPDGGLQVLGTGDNIQIVRCSAFRNGRASLSEGQGFAVAGQVSRCVFVDCDSYENFDAAGDPGQNADGFQISADGPGNGCYRCRAWHNSDDGFDFFNTSFSRRHTIGAVKVVGCQAWQNGFHADGRATGGDGMGFKLGGQRPGLKNGSGGNTVRGCLSWGNRAIGFTDNRCTIPNRLFHNTAHDNGRINYETHLETKLRHNVGYRAGEHNVSIADGWNAGRKS
jgi:hypothetical protein